MTKISVLASLLGIVVELLGGGSVYATVSIDLALAVTVAVDVTVVMDVVITGFGDILSTKCLVFSCLWDLLFLILFFFQILLSDM